MIAVSRLGLLTLSLLIALTTAELAVRIVGHLDADGKFRIGDRAVRPYTLPVERTTRLIDRYLASETSFIQFHPDLGWAPRPRGVSENGLYRMNAGGLRADREYSKDPMPGILRIAIFGDSFTHGDDVPLEESWGDRLEGVLTLKGEAAEVLNFGVPAYGMDQAYLRWRTAGREYRPHIVIFGFQPENVRRNVNLFRPFYVGDSSFPFLKPRFVLAGDSLELVNAPAPQPADVPGIIANFGAWPLATYEHYYDPADYETPPWRRSRLVSLVRAFAPAKNVYDPEGETVRLALAIIDTFARDVRAHGAQFIIAHLPIEPMLRDARAGRALEHAELLAALDERYELVRTEEAFVHDGRRVDEFFNDHYSAAGNAVVARAIADYLMDGHTPKHHERP